MLEKSSLFLKETDMVFHALFQTQTWFETARTAWLPKHLRIHFFFLYTFSLN